MKTKSDNTEMPAIMVRLQQFADKMSLSIYQLNKDAGLSKGLLTNAFSKKQGLTTSTLEAILNAYPKLNANWLIVGRGEMLLGQENEADTLSATQLHFKHLDELQQQCVGLIKNIQQMKQKEQADADARLLERLLNSQQD